MAYYQVLDRPAGTDAYDMGTGDQIAEAVGKLFGNVTDTMAKRKKQSAIEQKAKDQGLQQEFEIDESGNVKTKYKQPKEKTTTTNRTSTIEAAVNEAREGKISWDDVINRYPLDADKIKEARFASLNETTRTVIENIGGQQEAMDEFLQDADDYRAAGVDVDAVLGAFPELNAKQKQKTFDWSKILANPMGQMGGAIAEKIRS